MNYKIEDHLGQATNFGGITKNFATHSDSTTDHKKNPEHLFDIDNDAFNTIKLMFPENQSVLQDLNMPHSPKRASSMQRGIDINKLMDLLRKKINWDKAKAARIIQSLDHKDPNKITWIEFLEWFTNEGKVRDKMHEAGLFQQGLTRLVEESTQRLSQKRTEYKVESMLCLDVDNGKLNVLLCIFENKVAQFFDTKTFEILHTLSFQAKYKIKEKKRVISLSQARKQRALTITATDLQDDTMDEDGDNSIQSTYESNFDDIVASRFKKQQKVSLNQDNIKKAQTSQISRKIPDKLSLDVGKYQHNLTMDDFVPSASSQGGGGGATKNSKISRTSAASFSPPKGDQMFFKSRNNYINMEAGEQGLEQMMMDQLLTVSPSKNNHRSNNVATVGLFDQKYNKRSQTINVRAKTQHQLQSPEMEALSLQIQQSSIGKAPVTKQTIHTTNNRNSTMNSRNQIFQDVVFRPASTMNTKSLSLNRRFHLKKTKPYGILGLNKIDNSIGDLRLGGQNQLNESLHTYDLPDELFQSKQQRQENYNTFKKCLKKVDQSILSATQYIQQQQAITQQQIKNALQRKFGILRDTAHLNNEPSLNGGAQNYLKIATDNSSVRGRQSSSNGSQILSSTLNLTKIRQQQNLNNTESKGLTMLPVKQPTIIEKKKQSLQSKVKSTQHKMEELKYLVSDEVNVKKLQIKKEEKKTAQTQDMSLNNKVLQIKSSKDNPNSSKKKPYLITATYYQPASLLVFSLIDCENKFFFLKQSRKDSLIVQEYDKSYFRLSNFEVVIIEQNAENFGKVLIKQSLLKKVNCGSITNIICTNECGLIITTFEGMLQNYDAMEFKLVWEHNESQYNFIEKTTMTVCSYSQKLGYICVAGVEGKLQMYDISAKVKMIQAHKHHSEVIGLQFFDKHNQIVSISVDKQISLWDANGLNCIQMIKDEQFPQEQYTATCFAPYLDQVFVGCRNAKIFILKVNEKVELKNLQTQALLKSNLKDENQLLKKIGQSVGKNSQNLEQTKKSKLQLLNLASKIKTMGNVLVTENSSLVQILVVPERNQIVTIDSDYMLRTWNILSGQVEQTLLIKQDKTLKSQDLYAKQLGLNQIQQKLDYVAMTTNEPRNIAVSDEQGIITINNLYSGSILHKLTQKGNQFEINQIKFLNPTSSSLYLCATATNGNVLFFTKPLPAGELNPKAGSKADHYLCQTLIKKNVHKSDLYAIAVSDQYVAVGGMDNKISYWSAFTGAFKSYTKLPKSVNSDQEVYIVDLIFLHNQGSFILAIQNNGAVHIAHPASSRIIKSNVIKTVSNSFVAINDPLETYLFIANETGQAETYKIIIPKEHQKLINNQKSLDSDSDMFMMKLPTFGQRGSVDTTNKNQKIDELDDDENNRSDLEEDQVSTRNQTQYLTNGQIGNGIKINENYMENQLNFLGKFNKIAKWRAHYINSRTEQQVVQVRMSGLICISATNCGEVKIWTTAGDLLGVLDNSPSRRWDGQQIQDKMMCPSHQLDSIESD